MMSIDGYRLLDAKMTGPAKWLSLLVIATTTLAGPVSAMPTSYSFSYDFSPGRIIEGTLWGELQADMNTILVSDFVAEYDTLVMPVSFNARDAGMQQLASLDGGTISLFGLTPIPSYQTVFFFDINSRAGASVTGFDIFSGGTFDLESESFDVTHWSLTATVPVPTVPIPATGFLVTVGILALWRQRSGLA